MTDNKDRFVTPLHGPDGRSPGGSAGYDEAFSADAEDFPNDVGDIPATPEWEKAFAAYAKDQAPDLMPRILEQINRNADAEKSIERMTVAPVKRKNNRFRIITSLSGVAAAVIVIGILIILNNRLPKQDDVAAGRDSKTAYDMTTPTAFSDQPDPIEQKQSPEKEFHSDTPSESDEVQDKSSATPTPVSNDKNQREEQGSDELSKRPSEEAILQHLESRLKNQTVVYSKEGAFILSNASVGEAVTLNDGSTAYHLYIDNTDSGCLVIWSEAETGKSYSEIRFQFYGYQDIGNETYYLYKIKDWKE